MTDDIRYMAYATTIGGTVCSPDAGDAARRPRASMRTHGERRNPADGTGGSAVYVVMVAAECAPAAKAGGLGDMVSGLSRELELRGNAA